MTTIPLLSINVHTGTSAEFVESIISMAEGRKSTYVCVANAHMVVEAHNDPAFAAVVKNADIITPDGVPLIWALRLLYRLKQERIAGMDLLPALLREASILKLPVFFYGGTEQMLEKTTIYLKKQLSPLNIVGTYNPPFRSLSNSEEDEVVRLINHSGASIVFVVLGCPKQERWMALMKHRVNSVMIGIGGALPVLIKMQKRAPVWMQNIGLEWLFRLGQEPKRLFKRYAVTNSVFIYLVLRGLYDKGMARSRRLLKLTE
jgi:N-acetylglucosaminyldiphosphoundecaprenol N-acetyl-beta-D-mannosaminyltransferase